MRGNILVTFALGAFATCFFHAAPAACEEMDQFKLAALEISINIKKFRDEACQKTDAVLACHFGYSEALALVNEIETIGRKKNDASSAEAIEMQKTIEGDFKKINEMLAELRNKYGR